MSSSPKKPRSKSNHPKGNRTGSTGKPARTRDSARSGGNKQRRSHSTTRTAKQIQTGGIKDLGEALGSALRGAHSDELVKDSVTHPLHTYPARMHPATARALVTLCFETQQATPKLVLDPFCGSGTTLVEGRALGLDVIGCDLNPLAVRIARAKTWATDKNRLDEFGRIGKIISASAFEEGKAARRADYEPRPIRIPKGVDQAEREAEIGEWFAPHVRRELEFIAGAIDELREDDDELAELFLVCLSSILIKCSKRNSDTSSKIVKRNIGRGMPARWFGERVELMCVGLVDLHQAGAAGSIRVLQHDARDLAAAGITPSSIGAIISSPPYVGTYDYVDHHRLRLAFLGLPFDDFEKSEIGARRRFKGRAQQATEDAYADFRSCLDQFHDLLAPTGQMALMVGDSVAGVEPIWADELLRDLAGERFKLLAWASQERDKLGGLEKRAFGSRPKREHILLFEKKPL